MKNSLSLQNPSPTSMRYALIIGAMKCGTTSLSYYLSEHPEIAGSSEKETNFFSNDEKFQRGYSWYRTHWAEDQVSRTSPEVLLEASPQYTQQPQRPNVAERIRSMPAIAESARFIYLVRDPIKRIESHFAHDESTWAWADENVDRQERHGLGGDSEHIQWSRYAWQLKPYVEAFGRDRIHIMTLERLQADPATELAEVCRFLGVDHRFCFARTGVKRNTRETLSLPKWTHWIRQNAIGARLVNLIPPSVRQVIRGCLKTSDKRYKAMLDADQRALVLDLLAGDMESLQDEFGLSLSEWTLPDSMRASRGLYPHES